MVIILLVVGVGVWFRERHAFRQESKNTTYEAPNYATESVYPDEVYGISVITDLIEEGSNIRPGTTREIRYIVIHETDNTEAGVGAANHATYLKYNNDLYTSWHYTVDDTEIYHHLPDNEVGYHAGDEIGNLYGIGIELCVNSDGDFDKTFDNATKLVAYLLKAYHLTIEDIKTHYDFNGKDCPHIIRATGRMDEFKEKVSYYMSLED